MHTEFQLPHITGRNTQEQVQQIVAYLRRLALLLQELPMQQTVATQAVAQPRSQSFSELTVRTSLQLEGALNGIALGKRQLSGSKQLRLQSRFSKWDEQSSESQSFFLIGTVQGCAHVTEAGACSWNGTGGVAVTAGAGGQIRIDLPQPVTEELMVLSTGSFR